MGNELAGGNTGNKRKLRMGAKASSQMSEDVKALSGGEVFGDPGNLNLWGAGSEEMIDSRYGYDSFSRTVPDVTMDNVDGNAGFKSVSPEGDNRAAPITKPKKGDATPGGGW